MFADVDTSLLLVFYYTPLNWILTCHDRIAFDVCFPIAQINAEEHCEAIYGPKMLLRLSFEMIIFFLSKRKKV